MAKKEIAQVHRLAETTAQILDENDLSVPDGIRLDLLVDGALTNDVGARVATLVRGALSHAQADGPGRSTTDGALTLTVRDRTDPPTRPADSVLASQVSVGPTPTLLGHESAHFTVCRSLARTRARTVKSLIKDAKTQLPDDGPGAVFIDMPGAEKAAEHLEVMLGHPSHHAVAWCSLWTNGQPLRAVWRNDQPFDKRLLD